MINSLLVAATCKAVGEALAANDIPYEVRDDEEKKLYDNIWAEAGDEEKDLALRQARPAVRLILSKELYIHEKAGEPLCIRYNYQDRRLEKDSFGELLLERSDMDWHISISIKSDANVLTSMTLADRARYTNHGKVVSVFNEIGDFGYRLLGVPCSNEYFKDMNEVLLTFQPLSKEEWQEKIKDDSFLYGQLITPMLKVVAAELPRLFKYHPEAPQKMFEFFYGKYDYYYINPIKECGLTRIGAINSHGGLGRMPDNSNLNVPRVIFPTKLLDVRFANGKHGEISGDTLQLTFDGGWAICIRLSMDQSHIDDRTFDISVYMPVTPFGSLRDQVPWDPEA